jgi:hypothetical protein
MASSTLALSVRRSRFSFERIRLASMAMRFLNIGSERWVFSMRIHDLRDLAEVSFLLGRTCVPAWCSTCPAFSWLASGSGPARGSLPLRSIPPLTPRAAWPRNRPALCRVDRSIWSHGSESQKKVFLLPSCCRCTAGSIRSQSPDRRSRAGRFAATAQAASCSIPPRSLRPANVACHFQPH